MLITALIGWPCQGQEATMNESFIALLGVNEATVSALRQGRMPDMLGRSQQKDEFAGQLRDILANYYAGEAQTTTNQAPPLDAVQRPTLDKLYKDIMLAGLRRREEEANESGEITEEDLLMDSLILDDTDSGNTSSIGVVDSNVSTSPSISIRDIVLQAGAANADLVQKINDAATIDERLNYSVQLRDKIIQALKDSGHTAYEIGKPDKISIDGSIYDVIKASRGMGRRSAVQFMEVTATNQPDSVTQAIFEAGEKHQNMLSHVSGTSDVSQRRALGTQFRDQIIANLKDQGYDVSAGTSPDKITVNGMTYDIIRGLNATGTQALFHVIKA